ncbi:chorismate mutase [Clostridium sp. 'deep sea']|uniref:chorismate mutase n=1 Tax=Clostridium sp. 'deep sea' TaxID=2779445 RepID=UPI001896A0C4|nr:chorismate mutase [Clostridium sp. 'deep sea']QOR35812.1 chorismate mutase [Clostridium sp. 'deep sea']
MKTFAIRGATTAVANSEQAILIATKEMITELINTNGINNEDLISMFFTTTRDLNAAFPARAVRELGITNVALMCAHEMNVVGSLPKCIRVMVHVNKQNDFIPNYVYLGEAKTLRPDLFSE